MFQDKYLKYKVKYLKLKNSLKKEVEQKGGSKKNISTWGGSTQDNNKLVEKTEKPKKPTNTWE